MKRRALTCFVLFATLLGMAACGEDAALPTETTTMAQMATPTEAAIETESTATAVPTKPAPTAVPVEVEEIRFQSEHFNVVGDLQVPGTAGKHPVIVMVHGDGRIDRYDSGKYRPIMERFLRAGYAVFSWDKPGTGESTGELANDSDKLSQRAAILVSAIERLKEHPAIDPDRIGVWGISQAGYVMPLALRMIDDIAFMIVISGPAMDSYDQGAYLLGQLAFCVGASEEEARLIEQQTKKVQKAMTYQEYLEIAVALHESPFLIELGILPGIVPEDKWSPEDRSRLSFFNPIEVIEQTTIPVLAFFGKRDRQVDPFQGEQAYREALEKAGNQDSRVVLIPGVDHNLVYAETGCISERDRRPRREWLNYAPEYLQTMEEWLVQLPTPLPTPSGSGEIAFVSERDGMSQIYIMNADGSDRRCLTQDHRQDHWYPHWSPDGERIAFHSHQSSNVWSIYTIGVQGGDVQRLTHEDARDAGPVWSPDGTQIGFDRDFDLWIMNADGSNPRQITDDPGIDGHADWSPDGSQIALTSERHGNPEIYVMSVDGSDLRRLTHDDAGDWWPNWSPDGTQIAFKSDRDGDFEIYVINVDGTNLRQLTDNTAEDGEPDWSPDGTQIAFESNRDGNFEIYVMNADGTNPRRLTDHLARDIMPTWRPAVQATTKAPALQKISVDTVDQVERLHTLSGHSDRVTALAFSGDGAYVASSGRDGKIKLWDVRSGQEVYTFSMNEVDLNGIAFSPDGRLLASADAIWDAESKQVVHTLERGRNVPGHVAFSPDGSLLAVDLANQAIKLWDVASGQVVRTFEEQADNTLFFSIAFSPDGALLAAGGRDGTVRLWGVESGQIAGILEYGNESHVHDVAFSPDGSVLASGGTDYTVRLWDVASRQAVHTLRHRDGLYGVAFSPDGSLLASAGCDRTVKLWDVASGRLVRSLPHDDEVMAVAFSPDGTLLVSGGYDHQVYLWGVPREPT